MNPSKTASSFFKSLQKKIKKEEEKSSSLHRSKVMLLAQIQIQLSLYSEQVTFHAMVSRRHPWLSQQTPGRSHQGHAGYSLVHLAPSVTRSCLCMPVPALPFQFKRSRKYEAYSLSKGGYPWGQGNTA
jgi:hypothetical protein